MVREDVKTLARKAGEVGSVTHEEFAEYIVLLEGQHRVGDEWQAVEQPYMAVDGKLAMANEDHRRQGDDQPQLLRQRALRWFFPKRNRSGSVHVARQPSRGPAGEPVPNPERLRPTVR